MTPTQPEPGTRTANVRTRVRRPGAVAAAVRPDNTDDMHTRVEGDAVVTTIERETTGGLQSTVDDYVVNLDVATRILDRYVPEPEAETEPIADAADTHPETDIDIDTDGTDTNADTDTDTDNSSRHHS